MVNLWKKVVPNNTRPKKPTVKEDLNKGKKLPDYTPITKRQMITILNRSCKTSSAKTHYRSYAVSCKQSKYSTENGLQ